MHSRDMIEHLKLGFDGSAYIESQSQAISKRVDEFEGKLYLEIGGKFLLDSHAGRVLPWFFPDSKKQIFSKFKEKADILFCLNADDLYHNRQLCDENISYGAYCIEAIKDIKTQLQILPKVVINRVSPQNQVLVDGYAVSLNNHGFDVYFRYDIDGYPSDTATILSQEWYGKDDYIQTIYDLVLVTGPASSSGKMSSCLGQIYLESLKWIDSWYAKYETFPIWDLALDHPLNLAYEAATADIWDYNQIDSFHKKAYSIESVNYNRDLEAFLIVSELAKNILPKENPTRHYKSPTDMWISTAGLHIFDENIISQACEAEIHRRIDWYKQIIARGEGDEVWIARCENLLKRIGKKK